MAGEVIIVFRYDDYAASLGAATREREAIEERFLAAFAANGVPLTVGVVPNYEGKRWLGDDPARLAMLRGAVAEGRAEPALHGLTHEALSRQGSASSEFAGLPREAQRDRLREGKRRLDEWLGAEVVTFIPPWNTYDEGTLTALAEAGFRVVSAALSAPPVREPLVALPHTAGLAELRATVNRLLTRRGHAFVVCMFHHFSFTECADELARHYGQLSLAALPELLAWCREQPGVELLTAREAAERYRAELTDGRVDAARARWRLAFRWRRVPVVGRLARWLWAPKALGAAR